MKIILEVVEDLLGISGVWVSDESCFTDFPLGDDKEKDEFFQALGERIGLELDRTNEDDLFIVKVAQRLRQKASA